MEIEMALIILILPSAFLCHISHIVLMRSEPKMGRIHTGGIVSVGAIMANLIAVWNGAIVKRVRIAMGMIIYSVVNKLSIPLPLAATLPFPTIVRAALIYFSPKTFFGGPRIVVPIDETYWFALYPTIPDGGLCCDSSGVTATAMAVAVGNFIHKKCLLSKTVNALAEGAQPTIRGGHNYSDVRSNRQATASLSTYIIPRLQEVGVCQFGKVGLR
jgi:hypothetical protein